MRFLIAIVALSFVTTLTAAPYTQLAVSPDGRYIIKAHPVKRSLQPSIKEKSGSPRAVGKDEISSLDLFDIKTGETIGLVSGMGLGNPPATRLPEFKAVWSPDSHYVALSGPSCEMVIDHNMSPGADPVGKMRIDPHSESTVSLFRCGGRVTSMELPAAQVFATPHRFVMERGEAVDHWEGTNVLWTVDRRAGKLYRYSIRRKIFPW